MAYDILQSEGVLRIRLLNEVVPADLLAISRVIDRVDESSSVTPHRLVDMADSHGAQIDYSRIAAFVDSRRTKRWQNDIRVALVARAPQQFGVARMFQSLLSNPQIDLRVFRELAEAEVWVRGAGDSGMPKNLPMNEGSNRDSVVETAGGRP